ncbi:hypothetical protein LPJ66_003471 [Kickxella alabastrina]|uniref:Uncharacterized protein n=1 Tax=Kickxella alabastrina TaxID=61397 RepID=A0ACC1IP21_9FUNG|nr:hypothetical protein LPJ66_003471 [Kickxella alabastrina]
MHEARGQPEPIKETGRARAQRRKTGGLGDIGHQRRPSTAHGSPASKKVMYSQYPDFENITDPFAKRDKIPRKHRPSVADESAAPFVGTVVAQTEHLGGGGLGLPAEQLGIRVVEMESLQMEPLDSPMPESPNPESPNPESPNPESPVTPSARPQGLRWPTIPSAPSARPASPARAPLGTHTSSPRMCIDMNKVDTLYMRQSLIFENNKHRAPLTPPIEDADDAHIPFEQVLIPTAFKRLRAALEDPNFEIDEETYRRFKLSERWYVREERMQMEMAFSPATLGGSKPRVRAVQKEHKSVKDRTKPVEIPEVDGPVADMPVIVAAVPEIKDVLKLTEAEAETEADVQAVPHVQHEEEDDNENGDNTEEKDNDGDEEEEDDVAVSEPTKHGKEVEEVLQECAHHEDDPVQRLSACEPEREIPERTDSHIDEKYRSIQSIQSVSSRARLRDTDHGMGYVPPRQVHSQIIPMTVQDPVYVRTQSHQHRQHRQHSHQQHRRSESTDVKKSAVCGMCIIM